MGRRKSNLGGWAVATAVFVMSIVGWITFLWPPIGYYLRTSPRSLADVLLILVSPTSTAIYKDAPLLGWGFLAVSLLILVLALSVVRAFLNYVEHSRVGISILETNFEIIMQDAARTRALVKRDQQFHANRRGITAYHLVHRADSEAGTVDADSIILKSLVGSQVITKELLKRGSGKSYDVIEVYSRELPTNLLATYLPNQIVALLARFFDSVIVRRTGENAYVNEYTGKESVASVSALQYPVTNTKITVSFLTGSEPDPNQVRAFIIRDNAVQEIGVTKSTDGDRTLFEARAGNLYKELLRLQWTNR